MVDASGGYRAVPGVAGGLPRVELPEWSRWNINEFGPDENADRVAAPLVEHARWHVKRDGWTLIGCPRHNYIYSVGLTQWGWPEIVLRLRRLTPETAFELLTHLVDMHDDYGDVLVPGREWTVLSDHHVVVEGLSHEHALQLCPIVQELFPHSTPIQAVEIVPQ
jgi:hypothetical protein